MSKVFNSTNTYAGFYQTYSGNDAAITISRSNGGSSVTADALEGEGFMVSRYAIKFQRNVSIQRFLNMNSVVGIIGAGNGAMQLDGLVGKLESFQRLLMGSNSDVEDICNQLTIEIKDNSSLVKCSDGKQVGSTGTIKCSGGIVTSIDLGGQIDQSGVLLQSGSLTVQFTQLEIL